MITLDIYSQEYFNEQTNSFILPELIGSFRFENSLLALSKWESIHVKPFIGNEKNLTQDEYLDYFMCMCIDEGFKKEYLTSDIIKKLQEYMSAKHTATTVYSPEDKKGPRVKEKPMTSEEIYAYMSILRIPWEDAQQWELNRLLTLIRCIGVLQNPKEPKKRSSDAIMRDWDRINEQRMKQFHQKR